MLTGTAGSAIYGNSSEAWSLTNSGTIGGPGYGVYLKAGGTITNTTQGSIASNRVAIFISGGLSSVTNDGRITGQLDGVILAGQTTGVVLPGGSLTNQLAGEIVGGLYGVVAGGASAKVTNEGTIDGYKGGLNLYNGGSFNNQGTSAVITGANGVLINGPVGDYTINSGTVTNSGTIIGTETSGVSLLNGGSVANLAGGTIMGPIAAVGIGGAGSLTNDGRIIGDQLGVGLGGDVLNQAEGLISGGAYGVTDSASGSAATIVNLGTIQANNKNAQGGGIIFGGGGTVNNQDATALIIGPNGVYDRTAAGAVINSGTVKGANYDGVEMMKGGWVNNHVGGIITGATNGVDLTGAASTVTNFGTIEGGAGVGDTGVYLAGGTVLLGSGALMNGSATDSDALVDGFLGAEFAGPATVTNYGTITGEGGDAVLFTSSSSKLLAEAGSVFHGAVDVGGSQVNVVSGKAIFAAGLISAGAIQGAGTLALTGGTTALNAGATVTVARVDQSGAAGVTVSAPDLVYAGVWAQTSGVVAVNSGDRVTFTGVDDRFVGTLTGAGAIVFAGGSDSLSAAHISVASLAIRGATVTLSGAIRLSSNMSVTSGNLVIAAGGGTLSGTGELILSNTAANSVRGANASATLTDNGKILGAGSVGGGQMKLVIGASGYIDGDAALTLTVDTGANTITNAGVIYAVGAGGTIVKSAVANSGKLYAHGGTLTLDGAVTGTGIGEVNGGTLLAAGAFSENVTFLSTTGVLELAHSLTYTGTITGFSKTGTNSIDLNDIAFAAATTKATYSGTTASGILTVTDGSHTAKIILVGNYTLSAFTLSTDGHGGTRVVDPATLPAAHAVARLPLHTFVAAMAGFGAGDGTSAVATAPEPWASSRVAIVRPGVHFA
jgi:hypothetical protein